MMNESTKPNLVESFDLEQAKQAAMSVSPKTVLGFDPVSSEYRVFMAEITPEMAEYILANHNGDNRPITQGQVNALARSMERDGFLNDGGAITFNVEGNLTEFQHRLEAIIINNLTVFVPVVVGVDTDTFTKTAPAKARTPKDEIQRKHPKARPSEITCVGEIIKRRKAEKKFNIQTAIESWKKWNKSAKRGYDIIDEFFEGVQHYNSYKRTFAAWAALHSEFGDDRIAVTFLELLKSHIIDGEPTRLTTDFYDMFRDNSFQMSNARASEFMFELLCVVSDRMEKKLDGRIQLGVTIGDFGHTKMKKQGFYRKFMENPDNIQATQIF